jgi:protocatechuate 3,4-dioxygenase alpha subunit
MTTSSQTVGPFFTIGLGWPDGHAVVPDGTPGAIRISGRVLDGTGASVPDAIIETWQADPAGRFDHPDDPRSTYPDALWGGFRGFGRCATDPDGRYEIVTVKPGPLPTPDGMVEAPHIDVSVFARGLLIRLVTRIYFPDEADANAIDPVLSSIAEPAARRTLIATPESDRLRFDIHLQGEHETVFFAV